MTTASQMELTARLNGPPRLVGKALLVLCGYRGGAERKSSWRLEWPIVGGIVNTLTVLNLRQFIATYRDHYANARDFDYQMMLARSLLARARFDSFDVLVDTTLGKAGTEVSLAGAGAVTVAPVASGASLAAERYDTIVLIYPDALGLSWSRAEARALAAAGTVAIVNGRRRLFTLDRVVRRGLMWRRFLANTRMVQVMLGVAIVPLAAALAASDNLRRRS